MYKRVLLKLSGEALAGDDKVGIDEKIISDICDAIKQVNELGVEVAIVVGAGNFWRGKYGPHMVRTTSDYMGIIATALNGLALQDELQKKGVNVKVQTAIDMNKIAEPFTQRKAEKYLEEKNVVIFACGTGNPFFTTDTAASLRAAEMGVDALLVAKTIDGVYDADPKFDPNAKKYKHITYQQILEKDLKVMDSTAISLCKDNDIPLVVFAMNEPKNILRAVKEEEIGTRVDNKEE